MQNSMFKKELVVGIILLFVGTNIICSISATIPSDVTNVTSIQLVINNDGSGDPTDKKVDVPAYIPDSGITPTLTINFTIHGIYNGTTAFYGDDPREDWKNITVSGDVLYPVDKTTLYHVGTKGDWNCCITPRKTIYGVITLKIDWEGYGSAIEVIQISNGTFVTPQPWIVSFPWGQDYNLTFLVQDMDGAALKYANVYLIWEEDDDEFNTTRGTNVIGNGQNGKYTFWITKEDQGDFAPKNITIAVESNGCWEYAKVAMRLFNHHPTKPIINGPSQGVINHNYTFSIRLSEPDEDPVYFRCEWGDGNITEWIGPCGTGQIISTTHSWSQLGVYEIRVLLKDEFGLESNWSNPFLFNVFELTKAFLVGKFTNMHTEADYITVDAVNLNAILFTPFQYLHFTTGESITISNQYNGIILADSFAIGLFNVFYVEPGPTPNIACIRDSTENRLVITLAETNIKWRNIEIILDKPGATYQVFDGTNPVAPVNNTASARNAEVIAGQYIQLSTYSGNVTIALRFIPTKSLFGRWIIDV